MIAVVLPLWLTPTALQGNVMSKFKPLLPSPWTGRISFLDVLYICVCRETSRLITSSEYWKITQKPGIQLTLSFGTKHTVCCTKMMRWAKPVPCHRTVWSGYQKEVLYLSWRTMYTKSWKTMNTLYVTPTAGTYVLLVKPPSQEWDDSRSQILQTSFCTTILVAPLRSSEELPFK